MEAAPLAAEAARQSASRKLWTGDAHPEKGRIPAAINLAGPGLEQEITDPNAFVVPNRRGGLWSGANQRFGRGSQLAWWSAIDRNSRSSIGAPSSMIIATVTPGEGQFGSIRISLPSSAFARSSTSKAT